MQVTESTKEKIRSGLLTALLGGLGFVGTAIVKDASKPFADYVVPAIGSTTLLWLSVLLLLTSLFLGSWLVFVIFADKAERVRRNYLHFEKRGFWTHKATKQRVCGNCLIKGIESPLSCFSITDGHGRVRHAWVCGCQDCKTEYFYQEGDIPDDK